MLNQNKCVTIPSFSKHILILLFAVSLNPIITNCQSIYAEVSLEKGKMQDLFAVPFNDSVFLSYHADGMRQSTWIKQGGATRKSSITNDIISIAEFNGETYYYYLEGRKKSVALKALTANSTGIIKNDSASVDLSENILLASYLDKNFFLTLYDRKENQVILKEINGLQIVNTRKYKLPFDLSPYIRQPSDVEFFDGKSFTDTFKGASKIKLFKYDNIYLVFDQQYKANYQQGETHIAMLSMRNEEVSHYLLPTKTNVDFTSFLVDGKVFRSSISKNKFTIRTFDLLSGKPLTGKDLVRGEDSFNVYFRSAKENIVDKTETLEHTMKVSAECQSSLMMLKDSGKYIISWGSFFNENNAIGPVPISPVGILTSIVYNAVIMSSEKPGVSRYFYYECSDKDLSFKPSPDSAFNIRKQLDHYEIGAQLKKIKVASKYYIPYKKGVLGIYYEPKIKTIRLIEFK